MAHHTASQDQRARKVGQDRSRPKSHSNSLKIAVVVVILQSATATAAAEALKHPITRRTARPKSGRSQLHQTIAAEHCRGPELQ